MRKPMDSVLPALYQSHRRALLRFLVRRLQSFDDAEEISQEVFLRLWTDRDLTSAEHARALAFKVAANLAVDKLRRRRTRSLCEDPTADGTGVASGAPAPDERLHSMQRLQVLEKAIHALPQKCQRVFVMYKILQLSYEEISRELGLSRHAVEKRVQRGLEFCRTQLSTCPND